MDGDGDADEDEDEDECSHLCCCCSACCFANLIVPLGGEASHKVFYLFIYFFLSDQE